MACAVCTLRYGLLLRSALVCSAHVYFILWKYAIQRINRGLLWHQWLSQTPLKKCLHRQWWEVIVILFCKLRCHTNCNHLWLRSVEWRSFKRNHKPTSAACVLMPVRDTWWSKSTLRYRLRLPVYEWCFTSWTSMTWDTSATYALNRRGPRTDTWETPSSHSVSEAAQIPLSHTVHNHSGRMITSQVPVPFIDTKLQLCNWLSSFLWLTIQHHRMGQWLPVIVVRVRPSGDQ